MERELLEKMLKDAQLSPEEEAQLDALLASEAQQTVSLMSASAPQEELDHDWRRELNLQLAKESEKRRRRNRFIWTLRPAVGLALASAMAMVIWVRQPTVDAGPYKAPLEQKVMAAHEEATALSDLQGATVASYQSPSTPKPREEWTEVDLGAL